MSVRARGVATADVHAIVNYILHINASFPLKTPSPFPSPPPPPPSSSNVNKQRKGARKTNKITTNLKDVKLKLERECSLNQAGCEKPGENQHPWENRVINKN